MNKPVLIALNALIFVPVPSQATTVIYANGTVAGIRDLNVNSEMYNVFFGWCSFQCSYNLSLWDHIFLGNESGAISTVTEINSVLDAATATSIGKSFNHQYWVAYEWPNDPGPVKVVGGRYDGPNSWLTNTDTLSDSITYSFATFEVLATKPPVPVPEPTIIWLLGSALGLLGVKRWIEAA